MSSQQERVPRKWRELYARDNDQIRLEWDELSNQFRVRVELGDLTDQTPELSTFEAAKDCYDHPQAAETLGKFVMRSHAEAVAA